MRDPLLNVGNCPLQITLGAAGITPVIERLRVLGVEAKRLGVVRDPAVEIVVCPGKGALEVRG